MALIKCPECGKEFSDRLASCPQCGTSSEDVQRLLTEQARIRRERRDIVQKKITISAAILLGVLFLGFLVYLGYVILVLMQ